MKLSIALFSLATAATGATGATSARADTSAAQCSESFPARLADVKRAMVEHATYETEYARAMPWFYAHCRMLSELEIAVRKLDDQNAFVCDSAKGRPKGLTGPYVAEHSVRLGIPSFETVALRNLNDECAEHDARERVSLVLYEAPMARVLDVVCYQDERPSCVAARAALAAALARKARVE